MPSTAAKTICQYNPRTASHVKRGFVEHYIGYQLSFARYIAVIVASFYANENIREYNISTKNNVQ